MIVTALVIGGVGYACYHWGKSKKDEVTTTTTTTTTTKDGETTTKVVDKKMSESDKTQ